MTPDASPDAFKNVLSRWASGVTVVMTKSDGLIYGLTVSSFSSLSLDPPLITVCLAGTNRMASMIESAGRFTVSILGTEQVGVSNYFATPRREPTADFTEIVGAWTDDGLPWIPGSAGAVTCELHAALPHGDHVIVAGRVAATHVEPEVSPLLYFQRAYRTVSDPLA